MVDIKTWITSFTEKVEQTFHNRVWFIGLQGSYGRGEATETSDIDVVVILDVLRIDDLKVYRDMLDTLPNRDLIAVLFRVKMNFLIGKRATFSNSIMIQRQLKARLIVYLKR